MRIGHFIDTSIFGGAETVVEGLCIEALERGDDPVLFHFDARELASRMEKLGVPVVTAPDKPLYKSSKTLPRFISRFARLIKEEKVDLLHSHLYGPVVAGGIATSLSSGVKGIGTLHDVYVLEESWTRCKALAVNSVFGQRLVAVADFIEQYIRKNALLPVPNLQTIHNGTAVPKGFDPAEKIALRKALGLQQDDFLAITVGRLVKLKGHYRLVEAFSQLKKFPKIKLLICGDGEEESSLRQQVAESSIESQVKFLGFRNDVSELLSTVDLFLLGSDSEGLSCSIAEALMHGLPVVATDVGGNSELIENGKEGWLVDKEEPGQIAEKIISLFEDRSLLANLSNQASNTAIEKFSLEAMYSSYWELYTK